MNDRFYELPEQRQQTILRGAFRVFAKYDYKKASVEEVAHAGGISKALVFHYFGSKRELYLFLYHYAEEYLIREMSAAHDYTTTDFFDILADAQLSKMRVLSVYPDLMLFLTRSYLEEDAAVRDSLNQSFGAVIQDSSARFLARADLSKFRPGITGEQALNIVLWMAEGYMRARTPEQLKDLDGLNTEYLSYLELLRRQFYRSEFCGEGTEHEHH